MEQLEVKRLECQQVKVADIPALFRDNSVSYSKIDTVNWATELPHCPQVEFAIARKDDAILLHYRVGEDCACAEVGADLGPAQQDLRCEFFCDPDKEGGYYNLESNCIGAVSLCNGQGQENHTHVSVVALEQTGRWASSGHEPFEIRRGRQTQELTLVVPVSSYFRYILGNLLGKTIRADFYKCGDKTPRPHFFSQDPIVLPSPDLHCPAFFGELNFEQTIKENVCNKFQVCE